MKNFNFKHQSSHSSHSPAINYEISLSRHDESEIFFLIISFFEKLTAILHVSLLVNEKCAEFLFNLFSPSSPVETLLLLSSESERKNKHKKSVMLLYIPKRIQSFAKRAIDGKIKDTKRKKRHRKVE